jgi:tetratricopeptide (TPR) repeat protein
MAPEQAEGKTQEVGPATDVYALGAILYELLTGRLPFKAATPLETVRQAVTTEPVPPRRLQPGVPRDLETICLKCLHKEPARRYAAADGLADDLRRFQTREPIVARPVGPLQRGWKWARRRPAAAALLGVLGRVLAGGVVGSLWYADRERARANRESGLRAEADAAQATAKAERDRAIEEKKRADQEAAVATAVTQFLQNDLLRQADSQQQADRQFRPDPDVKVRTLLDRASASIGERFRDQPLVAAAIRDAIGDAYRGIGAYEQAIRHLSAARELCTTHLGPDHPRTLGVLNALACAYLDGGKTQEAIGLFEYLRDADRKPSADPSDVLRHLNNLADAYGRAGRTAAVIRLVEEMQEQLSKHSDLDVADKMLNSLSGAYRTQGKYAESELLLEKSLQFRTRFNGEEHPNTLMAMNNLGTAYQDQGKYAQAERLFKKFLALSQRVWGETHPRTLMAMNRLASVYMDLGDDAQAEDLCIKALELRNRVLGPEHPETLSSRSNLGWLYADQGRFAEAEALHLKTLEIGRRVLGDEHQYTLIFKGNVADVYYREGKYAQAERLQRETLEARGRVLGPEHPDTVQALVGVGQVLRARGRYGDARPLLAQAVELARRTLGPEHPVTLVAMENLALLDERQGKPGEAEKLYTQVLAVWRRAPNPEHPQVVLALTLLGRNLVQQKKFAEAEPLLREALKICEGKQPQKWARFWCQALLGASLAGQKHYAEAEPLLRAGYEGLKARQPVIPVPHRTWLTEAVEGLVQLYDAWGKPDEAARWRAELEKLPKPPEPPKD